MSQIEMPVPTLAATASPFARHRRFLLLVVVPVAALLIGGVIYLLGGRYVETDNAYVKATKVPISAEVSGAVKEVLVQENDAVAAGQPLFRLDPAPFQVAVARAEARVAQARTDVAALKAGYREKEAEIALAKTRLTYALSEQRRQDELVSKHFVSASALDQARQNVELASQQIATLEQDLRRIAETLGGSVNTPLERHPGYLAALAELQQARLDLARTEVRASLPGVIGKPPKPGQYLNAGTTAMALVVNEGLWIEANFPETDLTYVHPGQPAEVKIDTYPNVNFEGVVESLSPATGAEFSVIPAQNATGNWVKIAQRVPVRIKLNPAKEMPDLRAGLSSTVEIDTGHKRRVLGLSF
jgi:membrane fusion protein (multidrug efflux system)